LGPQVTPYEIAEKRYEELANYLNVLIGAARGIRTPDPLITNEVLYQLSYCGEKRFGARRFVGGPS
jgi:hypothetical protein